METTFYEDSRYRGREELRGMKRPMTLDLNAVKSSKKPRTNPLLTSPDLLMLKMESPEMEQLIIQNHGMVGSTPSQCMYPKADDRDPYPRDFPDALSGLQPPTHMYLQSDGNVNNIMPPSTMSMVDTYGYQQPLSSINVNCNPMVSSTMSSNCYAPVSNGYYGVDPLVSIKEEPQTVPCAGPSPPQSPIDMENQERMKLERKRLRNRIAASKCRRRKLERIARLEDKVALLKNENSELTDHVTKLRDHVSQLKLQVMEHVRSGCEILVSNYPGYSGEL